MGGELGEFRVCAPDVAVLSCAEGWEVCLHLIISFMFIESKGGRREGRDGRGVP